MKKIIERFCEYYQKYNPYTEYENAEAHILQDGTFDHVNYACESRSDWSVAIHMRCAAALALLYDRTKEVRYAEMSNRALADWAKKDYRNSNWWHNDIGTPRLLMHTALALGDQLEKSNFEYVLSRLPDAVAPKWTGANKSWLAENVICKGLLKRDASMVRAGSDIIKSTIFVSERGDEGVQKDYSFTQHGVQLYNHGYGCTFVNNSVTWGYILRGSDFAFSAEEIGIVTDLCLYGTYRMLYKNTLDFHPRSREIVRGILGQPGNMDLHMPGLEILISLNDNPKKKEMLLQVYNHVKNGDRMPLMEGNNMYWCVDYMTHVQEKYYASVRWASKDVLGGDMEHGVPVNSENILAGFAAYGGTCYMSKGGEYENIPPVWDWGLLPGTTTPRIELPIEIGGKHESAFVGGVSNGKCGVIAADMRKSYDYKEQASFGGRCASFMFSDAVVHLGNRLYTTSSYDFNTSYNQCLLRGGVLVDGNTVKQKCFTEKNVDSVYHDGIAYYNLDGAPLCMEAGARQGSWYKVYAAENVPKDTVTKDVFILYRPQKKNNGSYAYAVVPGMDANDYRSYDVNEHIRILANDNVQAVYDSENAVLGAVFYAAGTCTCDEAVISADAPCMLLYDFNTKLLSLCAPEPLRPEIEIAIDACSARIPVPTDAKQIGMTVQHSF